MIETLTATLKKLLLKRDILLLVQKKALIYDAEGAIK